MNHFCLFLARKISRARQKISIFSVLMKTKIARERLKVVLVLKKVTEELELFRFANCDFLNSTGDTFRHQKPKNFMLHVKSSA